MLIFVIVLFWYVYDRGKHKTELSVGNYVSKNVSFELTLFWRVISDDAFEYSL